MITPVAEEILDYVAGFREDISGAMSSAHPAQVVPHFLASPNPDTNDTRMKQLELWYMGYQQKRASTVVYKSMKDFVGYSVINPDKLLQVFLLFMVGVHWDLIPQLRYLTLPWRMTRSSSPSLFWSFLVLLCICRLESCGWFPQPCTQLLFYISFWTLVWSSACEWTCLNKIRTILNSIQCQTLFHP